jgi:hypothetical protein
MNFRQNLSTGSRVAAYGLTDMKLIVSFRNFANAPNKEQNTQKV